MGGTIEYLTQVNDYIEKWKEKWSTLKKFETNESTRDLRRVPAAQ